MKKGVIIVLFSLLTTTVMTGVYSQNNVRIQPGPVEVKQGKIVSLWCEVKDLINEVPVHWQSPPDFQTRTSNCYTFAKQKYVISCPESPFRWYNLTIMDVQWTDKGKYRCIHGESMDIVDLQVLVPVTNVSLTHDSNSTAEPLLMNKDMETVFKCRTNCAYPTPNISWFENGQPLKDRPTVNKTKLGCIGNKEGLEQTISMVTVTGKSVDKEQNTSTILCKANNTIGEEHVSMNINYDISYDELPMTPQPVMATDGTVDVAAIVTPQVAIMVVLLIIIVVLICRGKKRKYWSRHLTCLRTAQKLSGNEVEMDPLLSVEMCSGGGRIIYAYEDTKANDEEGQKFLGDLRKGLQKHGFKVELQKVKRIRGKLVSKVMEEELESKSKKVIISFPEDKFGEDELHKTFKEIIQEGEKPSVAVIIQTRAFMALPLELQRIEKHWNENRRQTQALNRAKRHLDFLQDETTKQVDDVLMNLGTGLASSYYLRYLMYLLKVFKETLLTSTWQDKNQDIPENRISKQIHIVFTTNCRKPKIMNSERIQQKLKIKHPIDRAGLKRVYYLEIQEVKSKDKTESYYGVVCFLTAVQCLLEMKDDPNKEFLHFDEDHTRTHGKDCFEKLKLVIKYNKRIKEDQSKFDFIEFNTEAANADENDLADELFNRMKATCSLETIQEARATDANNQTGILSDPSSHVSEDIKEFVNNLENPTINITNCAHVHGRSEFGLKVIMESKRIFLVLTDDFVKSDAFEKWFYVILDKGFEMDNKRFLVCLNCLKRNASHPKVLELEQLFTCICYVEGWANKVGRELDGDDVGITYNHLSFNIGSWLAMRWYDKFLKVKIPKVRDVIDQCPVLKKKIQDGEMSHKVFILLPSSCLRQVKVPCGNIIQEVGSNVINLPHIKEDNRDYTPKVYSLNDGGKEYYAFVEFCAPADTMYRMTQEGFLEIPELEESLQEEWEQFLTKLLTLIDHKDDPIDFRNWIFFIPYIAISDEKLEARKLEDMLLDYVKGQIPPINQKDLPILIESGATVGTPPAPVLQAAMH